MPLYQGRLHSLSDRPPPATGYRLKDPQVERQVATGILERLFLDLLQRGGCACSIVLDLERRDVSLPPGCLISALRRLSAIPLDL